ncbi:MAG: acylneuraminate cytidylyltransferase family protein, partial [Acidobacteriota bacterium]|nr:acylneuraminate cytidylyltransferase family protein [Acidobacteriota bacterium]
MRFAAIIPARGGSQRIPRKNLASVGGRTLVDLAICAALGAGIHDVTVSTDDVVIGEHAEICGASWLVRPEALSKGTPSADGGSSTEVVMTHWWRSMVGGKPDAIVLLQPTSPLRTAAHVLGALALLESSGADSVMACVKNPRAHFAGRAYPREGWTQFRGFGPAGYRPRTQDARSIIEDCGAIYVTRRAAWEMTGLRNGGTVAAYLMSEDDAIDVDEVEDLER